MSDRSQALMKQYYDDGVDTTRAEALRRLDAARQLMPDSAYVTVLELWANLPFIQGRDDSAQCLERAEQAVAELAQYANYPSGRHGRACYFDALGKVDEARSEWQAVSRSLARGYMQGYYAAFEYRHGNRTTALELLHESSHDSVLAGIHYGEVMALEQGKELVAEEKQSPGLPAADRR